MWHETHFSLGTSAWAAMVSGLSRTWVRAIWLRPANDGLWHALHPRSRCALSAKSSYGSAMRWHDRQKSLSCSM